MKIYKGVITVDVVTLRHCLTPVNIKLSGLSCVPRPLLQCLQYKKRNMIYAANSSWNILFKKAPPPTPPPPSQTKHIGAPGGQGQGADLAHMWGARCCCRRSTLLPAPLHSGALTPVRHHLRRRAAAKHVFVFPQFSVRSGKVHVKAEKYVKRRILV